LISHALFKEGEEHCLIWIVAHLNPRALGGQVLLCDCIRLRLFFSEASHFWKRETCPSVEGCSGRLYRTVNNQSQRKTSRPNIMF